MAEERLQLRHGGHKKWARDMRRFKGKMEDVDTREQYHEMIREKNKLKSRQKTTNTAQNAQDLYYDSEDDEADSDESASEQKKKAISQIKEQISDDSQSEDEEDDEDQDSSDESQNAELHVNFDKKAKVKKASAAKLDIESGGIQNMKFMKNAESTKKDRLKQEAKMLIEQIQEDE